jgi:hypothetical protein
VTNPAGSFQIEPNEISNNLEVAIINAEWITITDAGAVALARRLAYALDTSFNTGELKEVPALAARFTQILAQLHLTVETRTQGNKEEEANGLGYITDYLRVFQAPTSKPQLEPAKRGANSKRSS